METLEEFKKRNPEGWKRVGPGSKVRAVLYVCENKKMSRGEIKRELGSEINEDELTKSLDFYCKTGEIEFIETAKGRKYYLEEASRIAFRELYDWRKS